MKRFLLFPILLSLLFSLISISPTLGKDSGKILFKTDSGEINGAKYSIAIPLSWNKCLLMLAHGFVPVEAQLKADCRTDDFFYKGTLSNGWMIASTSYRRNGLIIQDAIKDIEALRQYIIKKYGEPTRIVVVGESMGGIIGTVIAETKSEHYNGILSLGMASPSLVGIEGHKLTFAPKIPIIFISNQNELQHPREYINSISKPAVTPVLWHINRDGHVNISGEETKQAFKALNVHLDTGSPLENNKNGTILRDTVKSKALFKDGGAYAKINQIALLYGNLDTDFVEADLARLGIAKRTFFTVTFKDKSYKIFYGSAYRDVPKGHWVATPTAKGIIRFARNYENAAKTLDCKLGDMLFIKKMKQEIKKDKGIK